VQADVLPRSVSRLFSARKTFSVSSVGPRGNTQLTLAVGLLLSSQESSKIVMISVIPSKRISIKTNLSLDKAMSLISDVAFTEPLSLFQRFIWFDQFGKSFEGYVSPQGFRIKGRYTARGGPSLITLDGNFIPIENELQVNIHWTLRPLAIIYILSCLTGIASVLSVLVYGWITTGNFFNEHAYVALGILIFFYIFIYVMAWFQINLSEKIMIWLFKEKPI
jgi:hypothetical protein